MIFRHFRQINHASLAARLMVGSALSVLTLTAAQAQQVAANQPDQVETVIVTGTNIRGAQPVGQDVISVGRAAIEDSGAVTAAQLLQTSVPQLNGFGTPAQASQGAFEAKIHSVGGGSSASTLTLVDGHRVPPSGGMYAISDASVVAPAAIERIEVLPDGASAVYGSDAVAGVINVITRKDYSGMETNAQYGVADHYNTFDFNQVFGHSWGDGSVIATYAFSNRSNLPGSARPSFVGANKSNTGPGALNDSGTNFDTFSCGTATVVPSGTSGIVYASPYTTSQSSATGNGICDSTAKGDLLPSEVSNRGFASMREKLSDRINVSLDLNFSSRINVTRGSYGSEATVTTYGAGSGKGTQINPFFVGPTGVNTETVSFNLDDILANAGLPQPNEKRASTDIYATGQIDVDLGSEWEAGLTATGGYGSGTDRNSNKICIPCTNLALNGAVAANANQATNASGNSQGSVTLVTQALTTANALNVWGALGSAKAGTNTSAATLASLIDSNDNATVLRTFDDLMLKFDGPLFKLPAGDIKVAIGGEYVHSGSLSQTASNSGAGPSSVSSTFVRTNLGRTVQSAFAEFLVPVVSPDIGIPLIQKLDFSFSGRLDKYSDVAANSGVTTNPKVGMNWQVYDDLSFRASWGTSFTAPGVGQTLPTGGNYFDIRTGLTSAGGSAAPAFTIPSTYPGASTLCPTGCVFTTGAVGPLNGIVVRGANTAIVPQTGEDYSAGFDFHPSFLDGLDANVTFWGANYLNVITNSQGGPANNIAQPGLYYLFVVNPTAAQTASYIQGRVANSPIPANIQFIYDERLVNLLNYQAQGIDYDIRYRYRTDNYGTFNFTTAIAEKTKFAQQAFPGSPWINSNNIGNASNTFSPVSLASRFIVDWAMDEYQLQFSTNWVAPYYQTTTQVPFNTQPCPAKTTTSGLGCQKIGANVTFDLHGSYNLPNDWISGTQAYVTVQNLLDQDPPFVNSASGYDASWGNPIGRLITFGLRKKW